MAGAVWKARVENCARPACDLLPDSGLGRGFFNHHGQFEPTLLRRILFGAQLFGLGCQLGKSRRVLRVERRLTYFLFGGRNLGIDLGNAAGQQIIVALVFVGQLNPFGGRGVAAYLSVQPILG
jgi:hypothetical protein